MGAWLAPVSRVLTHASASLRSLDREAGVITPLLDESPSLGLTTTVDGTCEWFGVPILVPVCQGLESCEASTSFGSCKLRVTELQQIECICLLKLETRDLVSEFDGGLVEVVITFDVRAKAPVVEKGDFDDQCREGGGLGTQELDKPIWEDVGVGLDGNDGVGKEGVNEDLLVIPSQCACRVLRPLEILDKGGLYHLTINGVDDEVGETTIVGLETFQAFSESDECGECGGVVACSYVGKLLMEECNLLSPHSVGEGVLGKGRIEGGLFVIDVILNLVDPFEGGLGHLLSQYGSEVWGETITKLCELRVT